MEEEIQKEFDKDCLDAYGPKVKLTGKFRHWCAEWDFLPIDETCDEFKACTCFKEYPDREV